MALSGLRVKTLALGLLNSETDRDKQYKVGASNIANPCTKHLAMDLAGIPQPKSKYWLGAKIGTAVHKAIEDEIPNSKEEELQNVAVEEKIILGELPDYGVVSSRPDLALIDSGHLIDWKTSTRPKTKKIDAWIHGKPDAGTEYTMKKYIGQSQLYAWGLNNSGIEIDGISLVFINRDGTSSEDVLEYTYDYDEGIAVALWTRLENIWAELQDGVHPESYRGDANCFNCSVTNLV